MSCCDYSITLLALAMCLLAAAPAAAVGRGPGVDLRAGPVLTMYDTEDAAYEFPEALFSVGAEYRIYAGLSAGVYGHLDTMRDRNSAWRLFGQARYTYDLPHVDLFAALGGGYYKKEVVGGDWIFNDRGFTGHAGVGLEVELLQELGVTLHASYVINHSHHHDINTTFPEWIKMATIGSDLVLHF